MLAFSFKKTQSISSDTYSGQVLITTQRKPQAMCCTTNGPVHMEVTPQKNNMQYTTQTLQDLLISTNQFYNLACLNQIKKKQRAIVYLNPLGASL